MRKLYTIAVVMMCLGALHAAPSLTVIQDILYKADGTRFNGVLEIRWNNFQAGDSSVVATQSVTVQIVNGVLKVLLVPTTNASAGANYQVNYSSAGKYQFTETWAVPPSTSTLRVKDVRVGTGTTVGSGGTGTTGSNLSISDISGLNNELLLRIMRGPAFSPGRAAIINSSGQIDAAVGNQSDCVRVDGSSAPCGSTIGSGTTLLFQEIPQGAINNSNTIFTLTNPPNPVGSLQLYRNGLLMTQGTQYDYIVSGNTVSFLSYNAPQSTDVLFAVYLYTSTAGSITSGAVTSANTPQVLCNGTGSLTTATSPATLATCRIAANTLIAGDRVEIKFGFLHLGTSTTASIGMNWAGTTLLTRGINSGDLALEGESSVLVASNGTLQHYTFSQGRGAPPVVTAGTVLGNIQSINTLNFTGSIGTTLTSDSVVLRYYTVTRYPAQ